MIRKILFLLIGVFGLFGFSIAQTQFGTLKGQVTDAETGEPLMFANIVLEQNGVQKVGGATDMDGYYTLKPIPPGTYTLKLTYVGYQNYQLTDLFIGSNKVTFKDIKIKKSEVGKEFEEVVIEAYRIPIVEQDAGPGARMDEKQIKKAAVRDFGSLVELTPGITGGSVKGQRAEGTVYYVDGVRVRGFSGVPQSSLAEINTITGGIPAEYGDAVGGVVSLVTKGPSLEYAGGLEVVSSELFDAFGYNTIEGTFSGPIIKKTVKDETTNSDVEQAVLGFLVSANFNYRRDPSPSPIGVWMLKDEAYDEIERNPLSPSPNGIGFVPSAEYITRDDMKNVEAHVGIPNYSYNINTKFDFSPKKGINITAGGQTTRTRSYGFSYYNSLFNYKEAAKQEAIRSTYRGYLRFTQTLNFGDEDKTNEERAAQEGIRISNAFYTLQVDYTKQYNKNQHVDHKDDYFQYGFYGNTERYWEPVYIYDVDTVNGKLERAYTLLGYRDTSVTFLPSGNNIGASNYTRQLYELQGGTIRNYATIQSYGGLLNGDYPQNVYSLWGNVGTPSASYGFYDEDQFRVTGAASVDLNNHGIKFGFEYEQQTQRYYGVAATGLWTFMRQLMNSHILQLNTDNPIPVYYWDGTDSIFLDTINYNRLNDGSQSTFDRNFREYLISQGTKDVYGNPIDEYSFVNIDRYSPEDYKLEMFSPDELLERQLVSYYGFDYLGNKLDKKPSLDDFLNSENRLIAPNNPIYMAGYIQDQFVFKDMIFRLGLRFDRFDANQPVLKDKFSLYPARSIAEVADLNGKTVTHPGNMGEDYIVYVDDPFNPTEILGYRDPNDDESPWYDASGAEVTDPNILALETTTGRIAPYLYEKNEEDLELTKESFKDYEPQINISPRVYFSFPLNENSNFYATYDIRVQRPTSGLFTTIDDYYYLEQRGTSSLNNAALQPQRITSYEIGFKQALNTFSAIGLNAYYNETRDQINVRMLNQAYPRSYMTFDNIDFSTTKGFTVQYDLRRTSSSKIQMLLSYTLQFADGTGSNAASQAGLVSAGQPNLRTPFPLNNDYRHVFNASIDYRYGGRLSGGYDGPVWERDGKKDINILENTGVNFIVTARSGRPYSKQGNVTQTVGVGIRQSAVLKGTMNGSRYPWIYNVNMRLDRDFFFYKKKKDKEGNYMKNEEGDYIREQAPGIYLNAYVWVVNLFDIRNVAYLYRYTGDPNDDGFISSSEGIIAVEQATLSQAFYDQYMIKVNSPSNYSSPRRIRLGLILNF